MQYVKEHLTDYMTKQRTSMKLEETSMKNNIMWIMQMAEMLLSLSKSEFVMRTMHAWQMKEEEIAKV